MSSFRTMQTNLRDTRAAITAFCDGVLQPDTCALLFFCSTHHDLAVITEVLNARCAGLQVVGCTTAGEFGPLQYGVGSISGVSFSSRTCAAVAGHLENLADFELPRARELVEELSRELDSLPLEGGVRHRFALQLIDGLSVREEIVTRNLQGSLGDIPLIGGSAGDDQDFKQTQVFCYGEFREDSVAILLMDTLHPIASFMTQHFEPSDERLVVTEADALHRVVKEINGMPAAEEYARCIGVAVNQLNPGLFSEWPVVVRIGERNYVRSIQRVLPDGSLVFFCAIEDGIVLRVARGKDLLVSLNDQFDRLLEQIGELDLTIGCDCLLRRVEIEQHALKDDVLQIMKRGHTVGFNTFGEQYRGIHINQTLTGIAFGTLTEK